MKTLQELTLFDRFLFNETMEIPGMRSFNLLNDTCIIMITPFDLFGKGKYCYTFHPYCEEEPDLRIAMKYQKSWLHCWNIWRPWMLIK